MRLAPSKTAWLATTGSLVNATGGAPNGITPTGNGIDARSLLKVVVLLTESSTLPARKAGLATVREPLPPRTTGMGPPESVSVSLGAPPPALLTRSAPLERETGPEPRELLLVT